MVCSMMLIISKSLVPCYAALSLESTVCVCFLARERWTECVTQGQRHQLLNIAHTLGYLLPFLSETGILQNSNQVICKVSQILMHTRSPVCHTSNSASDSAGQGRLESLHFQQAPR